MDLQRYVSVLWRWAWLLALSTIVAAGMSYAVSMQMPRIYSATTTLMVGQVLQATNPNANDFAVTQQLAQSYAQLVRRQPVLQATLDALGINAPWQTLGAQVTAGAVPQTQLLQITVRDTNPRRAMILADEVARQLIQQSPSPDERDRDQRRAFVDQQLASLQSQIKDAQDQIKVLDGRLPSETTARGVQDIQSQTTALQQKIASWQSTYATLLQNTIGRVNNLTIVDPATSSEQPISPNVLQNVLAAATIGFALAAAGVLVMELLDDTLKSQESVAAALRLPLLGAVGRRGRSAAGEGALVALHHPASSLAESYRVVRTGIQFAALTQPAQVLVVSSAIPGEGKSTTAANLAISMASAGQRVLLCDGDLRLPTLGSLFRIEPNVGLTDLLLDDNKSLDMAIVDGPVAGLRLVARGPMPPNAAEVLGSPAMRKRIEQMREAADVVIFDSPALLAVADATILAGLCDSVVLVVDAQRTRRGLALRARSMLERLGLPILGVVLNRAPGEGTRYRAYYGEQVDEATSRGGRHRLGAGLGKLGFER